jgi:penicillin-binding protein 2
MTATPMQLAHYVSVLANRGQSWRPRLVTALRDSMSGAIRRVPPVSDGKITSATPQEWQVVFNGMVGAATRGTAHLIAIGAQYPIAGKTGTAQVFTVAQNEKYNEKQVDERLRDHSWFIAFAPADSPRIAVAVLVENGGFGAAVAAPIARKVMDTFLLGPDGKLKPADPNSTPAVPAPQSAPGEKPVEPVNPPPQQPDTKQADTPAAARQQHG